MKRKSQLLQTAFIVIVVSASIYYLFSGYINPVLAGWPLTVDSASEEVVGWLSDEQKAELIATPEDELYRYHFGLGTTIRNEFGLWGANWALLQSACDSPCHPDDASMVIIEHTWAGLRKQSGKN
jgi:hypothetical protein